MTNNQPPTEGNKPAITAGETPKLIPGKYIVSRNNGCRKIGIKNGVFKQSQIYAVAYTTGLADDEQDKVNAEIIAQAFNLTQKHGPLPELVKYFELSEQAKNILRQSGVGVTGMDIHRTAIEASQCIIEYRAQVAELEKQNKELREAMSDLVNDCMASDFNEHWDSYKRAAALQTTK